MSPGDLNIALIVKMVNQVAGPALEVVNSLKGIDKATEQAGRNGVAWANEQIEANNARTAALKGEALGLAAMGTGLIALTEPAIQAEVRLAEISKVVDFEAPDGLQVLQREIRELVTSGGLTTTAAGVADIVAAAGRMGVVDENLPDAAKRAELLEFAVAASKMSVAFGISADEAGTSLARWRQNLGLSQEEAMVLGDTVNLLGNTMATTEADILQVINRQGVVAKTAGLATSEIAALSATLLAAGASPEIAATGMKNFTNALTRGESATDRQSAVFEALGIDAVELAKRMQTDATGGILSVLDAFKDIEPYRRSSLVGDLFGEEAKGAITPLIENTDLLRQTFERTADTASLLGLMEAEYQNQAATTFAQRQRLLEFVKGLSVVVGSVLLPQLNELIAEIMPMVAAVTSWAEAHPELIQTLFQVGLALFAVKAASIGVRFIFFTMLGPVFKIIRAFSWLLVILAKAGRFIFGFGRLLLWLNVAPVKALIGSIKLLGRVMFGLGRLIGLNPVGVVILAVAALAAVVYANWDQISAWLFKKIDAVKAAFDQGLLNGVFKLIAEFNPFRLAVEGIQALIAYVMDLFGVPEEIVSAFAEFDLFETGANLLRGLWDGMASLVPQMVSAISSKLTGIVPDWMMEAWTWVSGGGDDGGDGGGDAAQGGVQSRAPIARDSGGPVRAGIPYLVGERAPEIFVPGVSGSILPSRVLQAAALSTAVAGPVAAQPSNAELFESVDQRPALSAPAQAPQITRQGDTITLNIYPAPGADAEEIAREVARQLAQREQDRTGDLHDGGDY